MDKQISQLVQKFNKSVKEVEVFLSITRAKELQESSIKTIEKTLKDIANEKQEAIASCDESYANLLLGCECIGGALIAELQMWLLLKDEKPDAAWDRLIDAQIYTIEALRAHEGFSHLGRHFQRLEAIEKLVFPPQVFLSSGIIIKRQECSICGLDYDECEHIVWKPYMGKFCSIIAREFELDHVAIVKDPADKRCRALGFSVDGGTRNRMTWRIKKGDNST